MESLAVRPSFTTNEPRSARYTLSSSLPPFALSPLFLSSSLPLSLSVFSFSHYSSPLLSNRSPRSTRTRPNYNYKDAFAKIDTWLEEEEEEEEETKKETREEGKKSETKKRKQKEEEQENSEEEGEDEKEEPMKEKKVGKRLVKGKKPQGRDSDESEEDEPVVKKRRNKSESEDE